MCWQTEGTFTITQRCCDNFVILVPDTKLQTYLLTAMIIITGVNQSLTPVITVGKDNQLLVPLTFVLVVSVTLTCIISLSNRIR